MGKKKPLKSLRLFHGTSSKHLPSILKKGFRGSPVFFTRSKKQAEGYALMTFNPFWGEKPVVLEVHVKPNKARMVVIQRGKVSKPTDYFTVSKRLSPIHIIKIHEVINK